MINTVGESEVNICGTLCYVRMVACLSTTATFGVHALPFVFFFEETVVLSMHRPLRFQ